MTRIQLITVITLSALVVFVGGVWFIAKPSYESFIVILVGSVSLFTVWWPRSGKRYAQKCLKGRISFDYSNNNGKYTIGSNELLFETVWSRAGDTAIYIYNNPPSIAEVSVAKNTLNISDIRDASVFDFSSRTRLAGKADLIILKNEYANYAILKVTNIKDRSRSDAIDEVTFEYVINPDGNKDFK